jgi:hypothetical protein
MLNMLDILKRQTADGNVQAPIELLSQHRDMVTDVPFRETNQLFSELVTGRVGLPDVFYRIANVGVPLVSTEVAQWTEDCAKMELWAEVDTETLARSGNANQTLADEATGIIEAMAQGWTYRMIYGNASIDTEEFTGFAPRYSSLSAVNAQNIISAGSSSTDNMSVWYVEWGQNVTGIVPKGMPSGWKVGGWKEMDRQQSNVAGSETRLTVMNNKFEWYHGLVVRDWRAVKTIRNISRAGLEAGTTDLRKYMNRLSDIPSPRVGKPIIYMRSDCMGFLREQVEAKVGAGGGLTFDNVEGVPVYSWNGVPIHICDSLLDTEGTIS